MLCSVALGAEDNARQAKLLAARVDAHYNSLHSLRMDFAERLTTAGIERQESGVLALKKPGRMRWDYRRPKAKVFLSDGKTAYFYVPGERQARKGPIKQIDDLQSPLRFLLGRSRLEKELDGLRVEGNVITGVPKRLKERIERVKLTINSRNQIERIEISEVDGTRTDFAFSNIEENVALADSEFKFRAPQGVEVVELKSVASGQ